MADKSEISFGYDVSGFKNAMSEMGRSMKSMSENTKNMVGKITKGTFNAIAGAKVLFAALAAGFKGAMGMVQEVIPEIGTTFGIMQNIIAKNLLWPLRQALLPLLQKLLGWVEKNREMFVLMGGVLVNAFKMIKSLFESVLNMVKPIIDVIKETLKSIFGDTANSIADTLNLIMLKIMVFGMMVSNFLKPVFVGLADVIRGVVIAVKKLIEGFSKTADLQNAAGIFKTIGDLLSSIGETLKFLSPAFEFLGKVAGTVFNGIIDLLKITIRLVQFFLDDLRMSDKEAIAKFQKNISADFKGADLLKGWKPEHQKMDDFIVTKSGKVISPSKDDTIIGMKNPHGMGAHIEINIPGMSLNVTEGNAINAGQNFARGIERQIKNVLLDEMTLEGI